MASGKTLSKSETAAFLAERAGITKKQAQSVIEAQAELAYKQAKNTFVVPGLGKLVLVDRPARKMIMRFGPKAGQEVQIPKKKVLKFRIAKAAKDAILGPRKQFRVAGIGLEKFWNSETAGARCPRFFYILTGSGLKCG